MVTRKRGMRCVLLVVLASVALVSATVPADVAEDSPDVLDAKRLDEAPSGVFVVVQDTTPPVVGVIEPLSTGESIEDFYSFNDPDSNSANTPGDIIRSDVSNLFLFEGPGGLSLVMIHDEPGDGTGGEAHVAFEGLPEDGGWVVRDDPGYGGHTDTYAIDHADWGWAGCCTDGGAYQGLSGLTMVTVNATFLTGWGGGIDTWHALSGDVEDPDRIELDPEEPVHIIGLS